MANVNFGCGMNQRYKPYYTRLKNPILNEKAELNLYPIVGMFVAILVGAVVTGVGITGALVWIIIAFYVTQSRKRHLRGSLVKSPYNTSFS